MKRETVGIVRRETVGDSGSSRTHDLHAWTAGVAYQLSCGVVGGKNTTYTSTHCRKIAAPVMKNRCLNVLSSGESSSSGSTPSKFLSWNLISIMANILMRHTSTRGKRVCRLFCHPLISPTSKEICRESGV